MILSLFRKNTATEAVYAVYRAIVAQSRQPVFYAQWGVPDTVTGRFDMISLHMALLFRRLRAQDTAGQDTAG
jgi:cytochrome b pre-mRNA-processing protein 3